MQKIRRRHFFNVTSMLNANVHDTFARARHLDRLLVDERHLEAAAWAGQSIAEDKEELAEEETLVETKDAANEQLENMYEKKQIAPHDMSVFDDESTPKHWTRRIRTRVSPGTSLSRRTGPRLPHGVLGEPRRLESRERRVCTSFLMWMACYAATSRCTLKTQSCAEPTVYPAPSCCLARSSRSRSRPRSASCRRRRAPRARRGR